MKASWLIAFTLALLPSLPCAAEIDLQCSELAERLAGRLQQEGLVTASAEAATRTRELANAVCTDAQTSAQQQHEAGKQNALKNWLFESTGGKPGNKRLQNLKR